MSVRSAGRACATFVPTSAQDRALIIHQGRCVAAREVSGCELSHIRSARFAVEAGGVALERLAPSETLREAFEMLECGMRCWANDHRCCLPVGGSSVFRATLGPSAKLLGCNAFQSDATHARKAPGRNGVGACSSPGSCLGYRRRRRPGSGNLALGLPRGVQARGSDARMARTGAAQWFSEGVATFGLVLTILGCVRYRPKSMAMAVGLYITAAYWFTASTSFANPAVTIGRAFTDSFSGIRPTDMPAFVVSQLLSAGVAVLLAAFIFGRQGDD